jgi:hypothetical protein
MVEAPALGIGRLPHHGMAAALQEKKVGGVEMETSTLSWTWFRTSPSMRLEIAVADGGSQDQLDLALSRAI